MHRRSLDLTTSKVFLNCFSSIDKKLNAEKKKPTWIRTYNFMSLLNLPRAMELYGPLVNLWEGKLMGEAIIKYCKSELENGLRGNWAVNVLQKHYRKRALKRLTEDSMEMDTESEQTEDDLMLKGKGRRAYKRYESYFHVRGAFSSGLPISAIGWSDEAIGGRSFILNFGVVFGSKGCFVRRITRMEDVIGHLGSSYWKWDVTDISYELCSSADVLPIILLPMLPVKGTDSEGYYTIVSSDWKKLILF